MQPRILTSMSAVGNAATLTIHISEYLPSDIDEPPPKINTNGKKKTNKTSYYLLFISPLCSFLLLVSKQIILCMATERQENPTTVEKTD